MASITSTIFLRKLALRSAAEPTRSQLRSVSSLGIRSAIASTPLSNNVVNRSPAVNPHQNRGMATISAGDALARLATDHPHMEIIRYEHKNVKWTLKHVNYYSDALACGFLDAGLQPGDVVLSWLPEHFAEQVSLSLTSLNIFEHIIFGGMTLCLRTVSWIILGIQYFCTVFNPILVPSHCDFQLSGSIFSNSHARKPVYSFTRSIPTLNLPRKILKQPKLLLPRPSSSPTLTSSSHRKLAMTSITSISARGLFLRFVSLILERACNSSPPVTLI